MAMRSLRKRAIPVAEEPDECQNTDPLPPPAMASSGPGAPSEQNVEVNDPSTSDDPQNSDDPSKGSAEEKAPGSTEPASDMDGVEMNDALKSAYLAYGDVFLQKKPRTRKELTIEDKVKVIERSWTGMSERQIAREFNISKTAVHTALMKERQILAEYMGGGGARKRKARSTYALVDDDVWMWYQNLAFKNLPVSGAMIQRRARQIAAALGVKNFKGSNGWLDSFKRRHNIGPVDLQHPHSSISAYMQPLLSSLAEEGRLDNAASPAGTDTDVPLSEHELIDLKIKSKAAESMINMPLVPKKEISHQDGDGKQPSEAVELPDALLLATLGNKRRQGRPKKKSEPRPPGSSGNCIQQPHLLGLPLLANLVSYKQFLDQQDSDPESAAKVTDDAEQADVKPVKSGGKSPKSSTAATSPRGKRTTSKKAMGALMQKLQASKKTAQELSVAQELAAMATRHTPQQDQLSAQLMAAVRQFCTDTIQYSRHLQITGQISVKYDDSTITTVFNDNFPKDGPPGGQAGDNLNGEPQIQRSQVQPAHVASEKGSKRSAAQGKSPASKRSRRSTSSKAIRQSQDDLPASSPVKPKRGAKKKDIGAMKKEIKTPTEAKPPSFIPEKSQQETAQLQHFEEGNIVPPGSAKSDVEASVEDVTEVVTIELPEQDVPDTITTSCVEKLPDNVMEIVPTIEDPEKPTVVPSIIVPVKQTSREDNVTIPVVTKGTSQSAPNPINRVNPGKGSFASGKGLRLKTGVSGSGGSRLSLVVPAVPASGFMHSMSINTPGTPLSPLHVPPLTPSVLMSPGCGTNLQDILLAILSQRCSGDGDLQTPQPHLLQTPSLGPMSISLNVDKLSAAESEIKTSSAPGMRLPTIPVKMKDEPPVPLPVPAASPPLGAAQPGISTSPTIMPETPGSLQSVMRLLQQPDNSAPAAMKMEQLPPYGNPKQDLQDELSVVRNTAVLQAAGLSCQIPSTQPASSSLSSYQNLNFPLNHQPTGHLAKHPTGAMPVTAAPESSVGMFQMKYSTKPILSSVPETQAFDGQYLPVKSTPQESQLRVTSINSVTPSSYLPSSAAHTLSIGQQPHISSPAYTVLSTKGTHVPHETSPIQNATLPAHLIQSLMPQISQSVAYADSHSVLTSRHIKSESAPSTHNQILSSLNMEPFAPRPASQIPSKPPNAPTMLAQLSMPTLSNVHSKQSAGQPASTSVISLPIQSIQVRAADQGQAQTQKLLFAPTNTTSSSQLLKSAGGAVTFVQLPALGPNQPATILQLPAGTNLASLLPSMLSGTSAAQVPHSVICATSLVPPLSSTAGMQVPPLSSTVGMQVPPFSSTAGMQVPPLSSTASNHLPAGLVYPGDRQSSGALMSADAEATQAEAHRIELLLERLQKQEAASQMTLRPAAPAQPASLPPSGVHRTLSPHPRQAHGQAAVTIPQVLSHAPPGPSQTELSPHHAYLSRSVVTESPKTLEMPSSLQHLYQNTQHHAALSLRDSTSPAQNSILTETHKALSSRDLSGRFGAGQQHSALRDTPSPHHVIQTPSLSSEAAPRLPQLVPINSSLPPQHVSQPQRDPSPHDPQLPSLAAELSRSLPTTTYPGAYPSLVLNQALQTNPAPLQMPPTSSALPHTKNQTIVSSQPSQTFHVAYAASSVPGSNNVPPTGSIFSSVPLATHNLPPQAPRPGPATSQPVRSALLSFSAPSSKPTKASFGTQTISARSASGNLPPVTNT